MRPALRHEGQSLNVLEKNVPTRMTRISQVQGEQGKGFESLRAAGNSVKLEQIRKEKKDMVEGSSGTTEQGRTNVKLCHSSNDITGRAHKISR